MVPELRSRVGRLRKARAPSDHATGGEPARDSGDGTSRRTLMKQGLVLIAGAVGVGVAGAAGQSGSRTVPVALPIGSVPIALMPAGASGRSDSSTALPLYVRDVRFTSPAFKPGELPDGSIPRSPHGTLVAADGASVGTFSGGVLPGSAGQIALQRFVFPDGSLIGMGSGSLANEEYAVVGGTGRFAGAIGTYTTRLEQGSIGRDAEFTFSLTAKER